MTSYISYPSHKVTEILSKFLEFDPSELELGIWSGDLQLKNLKLRQETIHPILNKKANKPHVDPLKKAPLHLKLVKGTIGQMRIRIPWKRLVWGQGAVQIDVNELMIVLSFQSRQETEDQRKQGLLQTKNKKKKDKADTGVSQAYRDAKQRRLREAEKRHLQGMPVALYLDALHRKNSIKRDVAKAEEAAKQQQQTQEPKQGRLEKWLANKGSDLFWRFFAGIQGSITKARIVIVQDGVEIGCIVQSIEIIAGRDGTKINVNMEDTSEGPSESAMTSAEMTPPENVTYESAYDDGEHVDKSIKQQGLGLFVRKEGNMAKVPQALRFSSSVSADDYILRPVDLDFSFSFFYPYPPERRTKRALDSQSQETPTTATANTSVGDNQSQASGSKRRRDKRDRVGTTPTNPSLAQHLGQDRRVERPAGSIAGSISRLTRTNSLNNERRRLHQRWLNADNRPNLQRFGSVRSGRSGTFHTPQTFDHMSIADTAVLPQMNKTNVLVPRLDCRASLQEIRIVFTTRHYELLNYFLATVARMKNGRPDQTIRSTPKDNETTALHRQFLEPLSPAPVEKEKLTRRIPNASMLTAMLAPLTGFASGSVDDLSVVESEHEEEDPMLLSRGLRTQAIKRWWTYSIGAILWEVRKRKHLATNFRQMYISFDWKRQRHKRKEYVELYIAKRLNNKSNEGVFNFGEDDNREEQILAIEDELPLEQILLYRSIARSVRVRGMTTMPDSIQQIHTARSAAHRKSRTSKPVSNPLAATNPSETNQDSSLLGFIQGKFENSARLRLPGGIKEKWESQEKEEGSVDTLVQGRPDNIADDENDEMEVLSSEALPADGAVPPPPPTFGGRYGRLGSGYDSTSESDGRMSTPRGRQSKHSHLQAGSYYTSAAHHRDSHADGRTIRTTQKRDAKSVRLGNQVEAKEDERMKISFSLQIKCIDIMVVEENYLFDISPDAFRGGHGSGRISMGANSADGFSGGENSSSDDVSDLSGLTDDQRFFSEEGQIGAIAEEEEDDDERVRMHSTDFLLFGLPENPLLRLTIETLGCTVRGRGGGPFNIGLVVRNIGAVTDEGCRVFSLGANEPKTPVAEVSVASGGGRRSVDSGDYEGSSHGRYSHGTRARLRDGVIDTGRAISLAWLREGKSNDIQCDFSRLTINLDLTPARKMLNFYTKTDIKYPDRILEKSSRDVARKFMVYKTSIHGPTGALSTAIRVHDIELSVPIELLKSDSSEASDVAESRILDIDSGLDIQTSQKSCAVVLATDHLDVYTGSAVDEICATASELGVSRGSIFSGTRAGRRGTTVKTLDMLDIVALTSANDAFACRHWVSTLGGIKCYVNEGDDYGVTRILDIPVDVECLATVNETSLLESDSPQTQVVMEISPVHVLLSEKRLDSVRAAQTAMDFSFLNRSAPIIRKRKPDPPRIEILAPRILHSIDLNCKRVQVAAVRDSEELEQTIVSPKLKEVIMEECLADFLSVVSCFDFSLPNEEALSSAMQVCIGRLVGLGLSDDEAWGCTNAARLNFLDDIALMRQAQSDALIELSTSIRRDSSYMMKAPLLEENSENQDSSSAESYTEQSEQPIEDSDSSSVTSTQSTEETDDDVTDDDDDSANSAEIVETTLHNAVEKTIATFAPLLQSYSKSMKDLNVDIIVSIDLPMGFRTSIVKLFYDQHVAVLVTSVVATNAAGIELLTLVPHHEDEDGSANDDQEEAPGRGLCFTRYDLDKEYEFGKGGLPMAALASDDVDEETTVHRERARLDDIEVGEVEVLFASKIYEGIIDDFGNLSRKPTEEAPKNKPAHNMQDRSKGLKPSMITTASSVSVLFTSDEMVPFSRLTLEKMSYSTTKALEETSPSASEIPSWSVVSENASLQNLTPEGQFYPTSLALISPGNDSADSPFEIKFYSSPEPWKTSSKLDINFRGFRLFLLRQFIHEILHFFVYDKYGVGRLKKKYSKDNFDSTSSDMVAFEVEEAMIAISYIPHTFEMPTETTDFNPHPMGSATVEESTRFDRTAKRRFSSSSTTSEYHECVEVDGDSSFEFVSTYSKDLTKRMTITLDKVNAFTVIAEDDIIRDLVESPLFRFTHEVDGRASDGKLVYTKKANLDRLTAEAREAALDDSDQRWEQINTSLLFAEVFVDSAPHMRLFIGSRHSPFTLDARLSQFCLLVCVWDSNMQEMPSLFPFTPDQVTHSATPPVLPSDFPEYGSDAWVSLVETTPVIKSEICCVFKHLAIRCTFDKPGHFPVDPGCFQYFEDPSCHDDVKPGLVLSLNDAVVHVVNDFFNVKRIGVGSSSLVLVDERRASAFQTVLATEPMVDHDGEACSRAWADVRWGLRNDIRTLGSSLPLPVQCTVIMSPGWSLINVGAQSANGIMHELSWIWLFLDYFKSYWSDVAFGNPGHQAQRWTHKIKNAIRKANGEEPVKFEPLPGINVDFRLWLCKPVLCIPSDYHSPQAPSLRIESRTGLWYRYKSVRTLSSQEVSTTDLNLHFVNEFQEPTLRRRRTMRDGIEVGRPLVEGLSFGLRYDSMNEFNHKDVAVKIPYAGEDIADLSVAGREVDVKPEVLPVPVVCKPVQSYSRGLGPKVCEITCIIEVLPMTSAVLGNFFGGPSERHPDFLVEEEDRGPPTYSVAAEAADIRIFAIDPILGVQLPVAVASLGAMKFTLTKFSPSPIPLDLGQAEPPVDDFQVTLRSQVWADYFKLGMTRSWEPLLEPVELLVLHEQAKERGQGFSVSADSPLQFTLSGALLEVLGETLESFSSLVSETFGKKTHTMQRSMSFTAPGQDRAGAMVEDSVQKKGGQVLQILHEIPKPLKVEDRVAFSLRNLTGQKVRVHQQTDIAHNHATSKPTIITYVNQNATMGLTFAATISVIKNLTVVEVPYPGFRDSGSDRRSQGLLMHAVDIQIPGFRWIQGLSVDSFGRRFEPLIPRSPELKSKIEKDWRLRNTMMVLAEVGLDNGGRLVTVRALFEVKNSTTHPIKLVFDPDPRRRPLERSPERHDGDFSPNRDTDSVVDGSVVSQFYFTAKDDIEVIMPGDTLQIPTLLLEKSLQASGSHLGALWVCPETTDNSLSCWDFFRTNGVSADDELHASFCSRPIQLAKLVHESSLIFQESLGRDVAAEDASTGIQVSCPTRAKKGGGRAPFCYAIEVGRSPLVSARRDSATMGPDGATTPEGPLATKKKSGIDRRVRKPVEKTHGPVAYSLSIHAPLVIVNLLPEGGRFELMHAVRKTVVWFADLEPGQQVPVHSVGLDAPLLLLVNLGFCRTPVGEGALVHHGVDAVVGAKDPGVRLKDIGKAALKGTKQIGKTLTSISNSSDRRAQGKLAHVSAPQFYNRQNTRDKARMVQTTGQQGSLGTDNEDFEVVGGKVHSVDNVTYSQNDIATSTTVVDSIGQRLSLCIENLRGGGGQRRVSLFCPFWIVNTTEHSLRYKQEKGKSYVSGTVSSPERDGSKPVDGSNRNYKNHYSNQMTKRKSSRRVVLDAREPGISPMNTKTIFSGTPGALATAPGRCDLSETELSQMVDKDVPLEQLAKMAFMFNFHEEGLTVSHQMLCIQLYDGTGNLTYSSDWSKGFSLESVGFSQIVVMTMKDGRTMELAAEVNVAPGFLSSYTKIVRFLPRYILYNRLEFPVRLWQDSSVFRAVNEDRMATVGVDEPAMESRKWRFEFEDKSHHEKINQYEMLYGRTTTINDHTISGRIPQGTTAHRSAQYITSVGASEMVPFMLPDTRAERQLRVDLGGIWNMTSSFASDLPGEHTLKVSRATDISQLNHVSTRAAPKYKIVLPPPRDSSTGEWDGELGVFFETDWGGDKRIIVKGTKRGKFAYNHTDIRVGDELLRVDGVSVLRMTFAETMKLIKERITAIQVYMENHQHEEGEPGKRQRRRLSFGARRRNSGGSVDQTSLQPPRLTLTFRTLEERLRKGRMKANGEGDGTLNRDSMGPADTTQNESEQTNEFNVELKSIHNTMFVVLRNPVDENPAFQIQNRSIHHIIFYRQRGCGGHPWNFLMPGQSLPYSWEEPMMSKKLTVRVAAKTQEIFKVNNNDIASHDESTSENGEGGEESKAANEFAATSDHENQAARASRLRQALAVQFVDTEERGGFGPSITVRLEEIGYRTLLPLPWKEGGRGTQRTRKFLNCEVDTDGGTRLLIVSDDPGFNDENNNENILPKHLDTLKKQIAYEQQRIAGLHSLEYLLQKETFGGNSTDEVSTQQAERIEVIEGDARRFVEDFSEDSTILCRNQVIVEVLEAVGLNGSDFVGSCNPYCEVYLKGRSKSRQYFFQKRRNKRKTYYIEKSLNPRWTDQVFVFNVPDQAVQVTRGHHILLRVRNFRLVGQHPIMGQASVHLGSLRNQKELIGWYPLAGRTGRSDLETAQLSDVSKGSLKLRVQWVYTTSALIDYFLILSQARLDRLQKSYEGMSGQLAHAVDADERKREAKENVNAGRIIKMAKVQRRGAENGVQNVDRAVRRRRNRGVEKTPDMLNEELNQRLSGMRDTLKSSRDRYLYALYFQTAESKRNRQMRGEMEGSQSVEDSPNGSTMVGELGAYLDQRSAGSIGSGLVDRSQAQPQSSRSFTKSPHGASVSQRNKQSLDDFFAKHKSPGAPSPFQGGQVGLSPRHPLRPRLDSDKVRRLMNHRRLSMNMDVDEGQGDEDNVENSEQWQPSLLQGQALYDGILGQVPDLGLSDLISVSTDIDEEAKRRRNTIVLMSLGFTFHETGKFFHEDHLPRHFRRSLLAGSIESRRPNRLYRPRFAVGAPAEIRHFKSWQAAGTMHWDPDLHVKQNEDSFRVQFKTKVTKPAIVESSGSDLKDFISERLRVPDCAQAATKDRAATRVDLLYLSRTRFERFANRMLGSALNPGGWLTVRPITALNLPDAYTGMYVKLRYGGEVLVSETVNAKVTPRWGSPIVTDTPDDGRRSLVTRKSMGPKKFADEELQKFKFTENDLHVHVEPQQTSGTIKLSVMAERMNNKAELGVLEIPLGAAIAACLDNVDDENESAADTIFSLPTYTRWFPLKSSRMAVSMEGDMGLSARPNESEKPRDNMFQQYFAPCIQLAFIWWPDDSTSGNKDLRKADDQNSDSQPSSTGDVPLTRKAPSVNSYFNFDFSRISLALIDSQRATELLALTVMDVESRYSVTKSKTRIGLVVGWVQLDNHDSRTREPVVFAPTPSEGMQPTLQILALKDNLRTKSSIVSFEYVGAAFQEMDLTVEEYWVFELWEFITGVMRRRTARKVSLNGKRRADFLLTTKNCFVGNDEDSDSIALLDILQGSGQGGPGSNNSKVYIEQLILGLVKVNLSYVKGKKQSYEMSNRGARVLKSLEAGELPSLGFAANRGSVGQLGRSDQSETFARWSQHMYEDELIDRNGYNLPAIIAAVFPSVSDAPIRLQGKVIDHVFESSGEVVSSIKNFYVNETLKQVYKIIGSLDFVGNPTILFSSFVSGMRDLVAAPTSAFLKSPTNVNQVGIAVGKGTLSLFSHSASGIFGFAAKMSASAGQTAAILSLDTEYRQWHRDRIVTEVTNMNRVYKRRGVQSVPEMLTRPVTDILLGLAMGASGIVVSPYKGYKNGGGLGLVHGVAVGTLGVVAKPLVGVLDALTHMSATVHDVAKSVNVLERRLQPPSKLRLPYTFGPLKVLAPFDTNAARSVLLLQIFPPKGRLGFVRRKKQETHIHCEVLNMEPGVETYAIVTTIRVVLIRLKKEVNGNLVPSFGWEVDLSQKGTVSSRLSDHGHNGVALTVTRRIVKQKRLQEAKERIWRGKRQQEVSRSPLLSSASSVGSLYSDLEEDEEDYDPDVEIGSTDDLQVNEEKEPEEGEHTINHGSTKQGEEVLKWYTVLAEYQHRGQLTVLHNLVSSMVGDFDAIVAERPQDVDAEVDGVTKFGMFSFGRDRQGGEHVAATYDELVCALERLPWMPEDVFIELQNYTLQKRREFVTALRQNWAYATDLEASRRDGGPEWLIESRARAMHVNSDLAVDAEYVDPEDPIVRNVLAELEQGNITASQASDLIRSRSIRNISFTTGEGYDSRYSEGSDNSLSYRRMDNTEVSSYVDESVEGSNRRPPAPDVETQQKHDREEEISVIQSSVLAVTPAGEVKTMVQSTTETVPPTPVMTPQPAVKEVMVVSNVDAKTPASRLTDVDHERDASSMRMDRMENIVEQLVILNTNQIRKVAVKSTDSVSDSHSVGKDLKVADVLKKELEDLRNQVQARAAEDDALRNEISLLRQQLADRRTSGTPMAERQRRIIPVPDLLRFGTAGKKEGDATPRESLLPDPRKLAVPDLLRFGKKQDREGADPPLSPKPSTGARKQAASNQEGMVYREPLKDAPGLSTTPAAPKTQGKRPRRMSGGGMVVRRQSGDTMGGGSHSKRAPRRPSTGSISSTGDNLQPRNTRRHSADGVRNPGEKRPARRMSAGHVAPR